MFGTKAQLLSGCFPSYFYPNVAETDAEKVIGAVRKVVKQQRG